LRLLVTAGPTREHIDPVRFLSNPSSGRMGFAVATEAARRGHRVVLVTGPVELEDPPRIETVRIVSAAQMDRAVRRRFARCDAVVMTAAVADYTPAKSSKRKQKKTGRPTLLRLKPTVDILAGLGKRKGARVLVGFALETHDEIKAAKDKLRRKNLDLIVSNRPNTFGRRGIRATLVFSDGRTVRLGETTKSALARRLVREVERSCRSSKA
jgi:phosphopantothenoylcysteine decarboxylase/phosphopantothenate--cysteine ligase